MGRRRGWLTALRAVRAGIGDRTRTPRATGHHGQRRSTLKQTIRKLAEGRKECAAGKELETERSAVTGCPTPHPIGAGGIAGQLHVVELQDRGDQPA